MYGSDFPGPGFGSGSGDGGMADCTDPKQAFEFPCPCWMHFEGEACQSLLPKADCDPTTNSLIAECTHCGNNCIQCIGEDSDMCRKSCNDCDKCKEVASCLVPDDEERIKNELKHFAQRLKKCSQVYCEVDLCQADEFCNTEVFGDGGSKSTDRSEYERFRSCECDRCHYLYDDYENFLNDNGLMQSAGDGSRYVNDGAKMCREIASGDLKIPPRACNEVHFEYCWDEYNWTNWVWSDDAATTMPGTGCGSGSAGMPPVIATTCQSDCTNCENAINQCWWCKECLALGDDHLGCEFCKECKEAFSDAGDKCVMPTETPKKECGPGEQYASWGPTDGGHCEKITCEANPCEEWNSWTPYGMEGSSTWECEDGNDAYAKCCTPGTPCATYNCVEVWPDETKCADTHHVFDEYMQMCLPVSCEATDACPPENECVPTNTLNDIYCDGRAVCPNFKCVDKTIDRSCDDGEEFDLERERCVKTQCRANPCKPEETCKDWPSTCLTTSACKQFVCERPVNDAVKDILSECTDTDCTSECNLRENYDECKHRILDGQKGGNTTLTERIEIDHRNEEAAMQSAIDVMMDCLSMGNAAQDVCEEKGFAAYSKLGKDPDAWWEVADSVFFAAVPDVDIKGCLEEQLSRAAEISDKALHQAMEHCDRKSLNAATGAGMEPEVWQEQKEEKCEDAAHEAYDSCHDDMALYDDGAVDEMMMFTICEPDALDAFLKAGCDQTQWDIRMEEVSRDAAVDFMDGCLEERMDTSAAPTEEELKACRGLVEQVYVAAGGNSVDLEYEVAKGARNAAYDSFVKCYKRDPTGAVNCLNDAFNGYADAGGDTDILVWFEELAEAAIENAGRLIQTCMDANSGKTLEQCKQDAEDLYTKVMGALSSGGVSDAVDFAMVEQQVKKDAIGNQLGPCVKRALQKSAIHEPVATESEKKKLKDTQAECSKAAFADFEKAGGDAVDFALMTDYAADDAMEKRAEKCLQALADSTITDPLSTGTKSADDCWGEASKEFEVVAGGNDDINVKVDKAKGAILASKALDGLSDDQLAELGAQMGVSQEAIRAKVQEGVRGVTTKAKEACVDKFLQDITMTPETARNQCKDKAEAAGTKANFDPATVASDIHRGASTRATDERKGCLKDSRMTDEDCCKRAEEVMDKLEGPNAAFATQFDMARETLAQCVTEYKLCFSSAESEEVCKDATADFHKNVLGGKDEDFDWEKLKNIVALSDTLTILTDVAEMIDVKATLTGVSLEDAIAGLGALEEKLKDVLPGAMGDWTIGAEDVALHLDGIVGFSFSANGCTDMAGCETVFRGEDSDFAKALDEIYSTAGRRLRSLQDSVVGSTRAAQATAEVPVNAADTQPPTTDGTTDGTPQGAPSSPGDGDGGTDAPNDGSKPPTFVWCANCDGDKTLDESGCLECWCASLGETRDNDPRCEDDSSDATAQGGVSALLPLAIAGLSCALAAN